jgi:uncharacterized SAM-binding protein YcdF (DUF218 family)
LLLTGTVVTFGAMRWGQNLLVSDQSPPAHADAAVVLQGSTTAEKARIAGAIALLQRGAADRILLSIPRESYWGQSMPPVARAFLERTYGADLASRVEFCETGEEVDSTFQEAQSLKHCIAEHHLRSIVVVTSNYHTRRAGILWRRGGHEPDIELWIHGVPDPEFEQPWYRHRRAAKTFLLETTKLVWTLLGGN